MLWRLSATAWQRGSGVRLRRLRLWLAYPMMTSFRYVLHVPYVSCVALGGNPALQCICIAACCMQTHCRSYGIGVRVSVCLSVRLSVCLSLTDGLLTQNRNGVEKPKMVRKFPGARVSGLPTFISVKDSRSRSPEVRQLKKIWQRKYGKSGAVHVCLRVVNHAPAEWLQKIEPRLHILWGKLIFVDSVFHNYMIR